MRHVEPAGIRYDGCSRHRSPSLPGAALALAVTLVATTAVAQPSPPEPVESPPNPPIVESPPSAAAPAPVPPPDAPSSPSLPWPGASLAADGFPMAGWHNGLFFLRDRNDRFRL